MTRIALIPPVDVSRETSDRLRNYTALLLRWNSRINLIGPSAPDEVWERHVLDSLQLAPMLAGVARAVDLGSGAGLPGLVLAIATGVPFTLVEADRRKAAFLTEAARQTAAPVTVLSQRAEHLQIPPAPAVTARALAPLRILLGLAQPLLAEGGFCLFPKGARADEELTDAATEWQMNVQRFASRTSPQSSIFRISEIARARGAA